MRHMARPLVLMLRISRFEVDFASGINCIVVARGMYKLLVNLKLHPMNETHPWDSCHYLNVECLPISKVVKPT